jgi:L-seryl-tRNA(Ser) seleniumtransferase
LGATLTLYLDPDQATRVIPVLAMLTLTSEELADRASRLASLCPRESRPQTIPGESAVGGGSFPGAVLPTTLVALEPVDLSPDGLALRLRLGKPSIMSRVADGRVLLDPRTLPEDTFTEVAQAVEAALRS